jgi:hypothetical protein
VAPAVSKHIHFKVRTYHFYIRHCDTRQGFTLTDDDDNDDDDYDDDNDDDDDDDNGNTTSGKIKSIFKLQSDPKVS